jgi:hypothetical protein
MSRVKFYIFFQKETSTTIYCGFDPVETLWITEKGAVERLLEICEKIARSLAFSADSCSIRRRKIRGQKLMVNHKILCEKEKTTPYSAETRAFTTKCCEGPKNTIFSLRGCGPAAFAAARG